MSRRFPAPWFVRELEQAFRVEDANGQAVAYTYFRRDENTARQANVLTHNEARRIAANIGQAARGCCPVRARNNLPSNRSPAGFKFSSVDIPAATAGGGSRLSSPSGEPSNVLTRLTR